MAEIILTMYTIISEENIAILGIVHSKRIFRNDL
jgi:hypothetical protein